MEFWLRNTGVVRLERIGGQGCGLEELQTVIDAADCAADPDARRARGPHSL